MNASRLVVSWLLTWSIMLVGSRLASAGPIEWQPDLEQARQRAWQQNRLLLIHFWSPDCVPCLQLEKNVFPQDLVAEALNATVVPVKVDASQNPGLASLLGVQSWPTDVLVTPDGKVVGRWQSPQDAKQYVSRFLQGTRTANMQLAEIADQSQQALETAGQQAHAIRDRLESEAELLVDQGRSSMAQIQQDASQWVGNLQSDIQQVAEEAGQLKPSDPSIPGSATVENPFVATESRGAGQSAAPSNPAPGSRSTAVPDWAPPGSGPPANTDVPWPSAAPSAAPPAADRGSHPSESPSAGLTSSAAGPPTSAAAPPASAAGPPSTTTPPAQPGRAQAQSEVPWTANPSPPSWQDSPMPSAEMPAGGVAGPQSPAPGQSAAANASAGPPSGLAPDADSSLDHPAVGMDGYCPVTLLEDNRWQRGDARWGAIHRGRTYLFASQEYQQRFIESPDRYSPVLAGIDPVMLVDQGKVVSGKRAHGVVFDDHVYLFSSEEALRKFWSAPETYAQPIRQAMRTGSIQQMLR